MPLNELAVPERVVGEKEVRRAMERNLLKKVFIALDCEPKVVSGLVEVAAKANVEVEETDSKQKLGRACAIDRPAAVAGLLKH